jgi:hypothetical protein
VLYRVESDLVVGVYGLMVLLSLVEVVVYDFEYGVVTAY